jgi:protease-4
MTARTLVALFLCASLISAKPATTRPTRSPATTPAAMASAKPATQPAGKFPSLGETLAKLQEKNQKTASEPKVAYIDLDRPIAEKPASFVLFGDTNITLQSLLKRLHQARDDKEIRAVLINIGDTEFNLSQAQEMRDALGELNKAGKRTFFYADSYATDSYVAASGASDICTLSGGEVMMPGVGMELMFAKGLFDKLGVKADYIQIGQYKGADEAMTRTEPSKEFAGEINKLLDSLYSQIIEGIAYHRNLQRSAVEDAINGVVMTAKVAKERGFIDHLVDQDGLRDLMKKELGREVDLVHDYGEPQRKEVDFSNPFAMLGELFGKQKKTVEDHKPAVALIYADGVIVDGEADDGLFGGGQIGGDDLRKALRMAARDEDVEAIVIRIDSPGGSALASEVMWQAVRRAAKEKPVIISVGSMAASGGYYLASAGDYIFADPTGIVGSIGVVGGKFVFKDLFDKLGLTTSTFIRGKNADLFGSNQPFTEQQRRLVTNWMKQTYEQFTDRVMTTRGRKIKDIDQVAHGRIFAAKQARELGMVDELGGLEKAIAYAADRAKLKSGAYEIKTLPPQRSLIDLLRGDGAEAKTPVPDLSLAQDSILRVLPRATARLAIQQLQILQLFRDRPVALVSPFVLTIR